MRRRATPGRHTGSQSDTGRSCRAPADSPLAFPGIETDVVVIAASAEEYCRLPHALGHFETEHAGVKRHGTLEVRNLQVNVADLGAGIDGLGHIPMIAHERAAGQIRPTLCRDRSQRPP